MAPAYRFLDRWVVQAPIDSVYDTIGVSEPDMT